MPLRLLFALFTIGAVVVATTACSHGGCLSFCPPNAYDMKIDADCGDLVSAQGSCGQTAVCEGPSPCSALRLAPPPRGGDCQVTITFSDGTTRTVDAHWGARSSSPCCGTSYEATPQVSFCSAPPPPAFQFPEAGDALSE